MRLIGAGGLLALLLSGRAALGRDRFVSIDLAVSPAEQPTIVCIVGKAREPVADCSFRYPDVETKTNSRSVPSNHKACIEVFQQSWAPKGAAWEEPSDPGVNKPSDAGGKALACAVNSQLPLVSTGAARRTPARILVLTLGKGPVEGAAEPIVNGVSMHGSTVALRLGAVGTGLDAAAAHIGVAGGDYAKGAATVSIKDQERVVLALVPLEIHRPLQLPPHRQRDSGGAAFKCVPADRCELLSAGEIVIKRSPASTQDPSIQVVSDELDAESEWTSALPPDVIRPLARRVQFSWNVACLEPVKSPDDCPQVSLPTAAARCRTTGYDRAADRCEYECSSTVAGHEGFSIPTVAEFSVGKPKAGAKDNETARVIGSFQRELSYAGQVIDGYIPESERQLLVSFVGWPDIAAFIGNRIHHVSVLGHGGQAIAVRAQPGETVRIPFSGLSCQDRVPFDFVGDLAYTHAVGVVGAPIGAEACPAGTLCLPPPREKLDELVTVGLAAGGGGYYPHGLWDGKRYATAGAEWMAALELVGRFNTWKFWGGFEEGRLGLIVSYQWAEGLYWDGSQGSPPLTVSRRYPFIRVDAIGHWVRPLKERWYLGVGGGFIYGRPLFNGDLAFTAQQLSWVPIELTFGYRTSTRVAVEFRWLNFFERQHDTTLDTLGSRPSASDNLTLSFLYGLGLRFDL